jgi:hypothetical protein
MADSCFQVVKRVLDKLYMQIDGDEKKEGFGY